MESLITECRCQGHATRESMWDFSYTSQLMSHGMTWPHLTSVTENSQNCFSCTSLTIRNTCQRIWITCSILACHQRLFIRHQTVDDSLQASLRCLHAWQLSSRVTYCLDSMVNCPCTTRQPQALWWSCGSHFRIE